MKKIISLFIILIAFCNCYCNYEDTEDYNVIYSVVYPDKTCTYTVISDDYPTICAYKGINYLSDGEFYKPDQGPNSALDNYIFASTAPIRIEEVTVIKK